MVVHMRPTRPLRLTHDLVEVVERVLEGGVLFEDREDPAEPRQDLPGPPRRLSIPLGHLDVLTLHTGHSVRPATKPAAPRPARHPR